MPFLVKKKVFDAAVTTSLLYGCESWLNCDIKAVQKHCKLLPAGSCLFCISFLLVGLYI